VFIIFVLVKRKRTQALLGSNLQARLFADILQKGRLFVFLFSFAGILSLLRKPNVWIFSITYKYPIKAIFYQ
jgi:hypothetical protein